MNFGHLNFFNISTRFTFPFFFDLHLKDSSFFRYGCYNFDYIREPVSGQEFVLLDLGLKSQIRLPLSFFFSPFPKRLKTTKLYF